MKYKYIIFLALVFHLFFANAQDKGVETTTHWNASRGYAPFAYATSSGIYINNNTDRPLSDFFGFSTPVTNFQIIFRCANLHGKPGGSYEVISEGRKKRVKDPQWNFYITYGNREKASISVAHKEVYDAISSHTEGIIIINTGNGIKTIPLPDGFDIYTGPNQWRIRMGDGIMEIFGGNHKEIKIADIPMDSNEFAGFGFEALPGASIQISDISFTIYNGIGNGEGCHYELEDVKELIENSSDPICGYWTIFDRNLEENLLKMGGEYRFAIIPHDNHYEIIYLSGAIINHTLWQPGATKGYLYREPFAGIYNVEWIDAEGKILSNGIKAQKEDGNILAIQFPYHSSTFRLRKLE